MKFLSSYQTSSLSPGLHLQAKISASAHQRYSRHFNHTTLVHTLQRTQPLHMSMQLWLGSLNHWRFSHCWVILKYSRKRSVVSEMSSFLLFIQHPSHCGWPKLSSLLFIHLFSPCLMGWSREAVSVVLSRNEMMPVFELTPNSSESLHAGCSDLRKALLMCRALLPLHSSAPFKGVNTTTKNFASELPCILNLYPRAALRQWFSGSIRK